MNFDLEESDSNDIPTVSSPLQPLTLDSLIASSSKESMSSTPLHNRSHDEAILHACDSQVGTLDEKKKTLFLVDYLSLTPFALVDANGNEETALTSKHIIAKLPDHLHIRPILPAKRPFYDTDNDSLCTKCTTIAAPGLERLLLSSPFTNLLQQREYVELNNNIADMINKDWMFFSQVKYATAKLFAGSILLNTQNGQAIMANTVEVYGRTKHVDSHREHFAKIKENVTETSLPPATSPYKGIWPTMLHSHDHTAKLVIGSQVSNLLITSSLRLDTKNLMPCVGTTGNFDIGTFTDSMSTRIFVDKECLAEATAMMKTEADNITRLSDSLILYQLRQIRSKFDASSAYNLVRASGPLTQSHLCYPFTVFTIADYNQINSPAAILFRLVALQALKHGSNAVLPKAMVEQLASKATGKMKRAFDEILLAYNNTTTIPVLNNEYLAKPLATMADLLAPTIVTANKLVSNFILQEFSRNT